MNWWQRFKNWLAEDPEKRPLVPDESTQPIPSGFFIPTGTIPVPPDDRKPTKDES